MPPKYLSGYQKRKKKEKEAALIQSQAGDINKYFKKGSETQENVENVVNHESTNVNMNVPVNTEETNAKESEGNEDEDAKEPEEVDAKEIEEEGAKASRENQHNYSLLDLDDPKNWENKDQKMIDYLVEIGPKRVEGIPFPKDAAKRHFDASHFTRLLPSGKKVDRRWLVYSISLDKVYCFCCKLFCTPETMKKVGQLGGDGFKDWHNLGRPLKGHDKNEEHLHCMACWAELECRLKGKSTIDRSVQLLIDEEKARWREVLTRIIAIVTTLSKNALPFRGDNEKLYADSNGLFLQLVEMVAKFDAVMKDHVRRARAREIQYTYLGKQIQNELIQMLAGEVRNSVIKIIKQAKYFTVILDCTPDASHEEQMSLVIRCVHDSIDSVAVEEYWLEFLKINDRSGLGLFTELKNVLTSLDLDIDDIRGQGYDNGSNMSGKYKGVQSRLLEINPRAFYTPCGCHSLNLALCDMVRCSAKAQDFFGVIQKIYTLFSSSTKRWQIFKDKVQGLTVKPLSQTRWESHIESVRPIKENTQGIIDALLDLAESDVDDITQHDARTCADHVAKFEFLLSLVIWYRLLVAVNTASKCLQAESIDIDGAIGLLQGLDDFLEDYREHGFEAAMDEAEEKAMELGIEAIFQEKRTIRRKRHFDESATEEVHRSPKESFRVDYFLCVVDQAQSSLKTRFEHFKLYAETFGFLFDVQKLRSMTSPELLKCCMNLEKYLTHDGHLDIDGDELHSELMVLRVCLPDEVKRAIEVLQYMKTSLNGIFQHTYIAYQILLTVPVTVASAERSFSKLKLIKTYLRSTMSQERLNGLAILSIEKEMANKLDCEHLISVFASKNARRTIFK